MLGLDSSYLLLSCGCLFRNKMRFGFQGLLIVAVIGTILFVVALGAKADGYGWSGEMKPPS